MTVSWDLLFFIIAASFMSGFAFKDRRYWFAAFYALFVLAGAISAIGGGVEL